MISKAYGRKSERDKQEIVAGEVVNRRLLRTGRKEQAQNAYLKNVKVNSSLQPPSHHLFRGFWMVQSMFVTILDSHSPKARIQNVITYEVISWHFLRLHC